MSVRRGLGMTKNEEIARSIALVLPLLLLLGALGSQYLGGLYPCEMCHWQRWPHYSAVLLAAATFVVPQRSLRASLVLVAALLIGISGAIGLFHAGVEYHWWNGITACTTTVSMAGTTPAERLAAIMNAPMVRCDSAQWSLAGISLAGFNAIFSLGGAITIFVLMRKTR
ncbi:Periplasmic thiol:disulfide oxidoreductase DsbB, required for DsbA reoxidation [Sphingomonas sp. T1]|uniref:Disulfide bond formation protein DsbB n=2 Tax=Sphingomonadaceae TaxID=41297 RepID=A0A2T4YPH8_9SPHN|nr:disulfide bond formation protein DsbB [Sphingomonas sp. BK481]MBP2513492.1 disulfide bond formation protein DsbB [Sphingomonas sp. PvP018]PTM45409.1 disulfide bond formation protein DsbB [Sphingomonas aerolata]VXC55698.1 Periplasmic thiol:disulfide oxidoreductase DsbB, required for DsbA reoxidation [Sphingomonas sp. T1]